MRSQSNESKQLQKIGALLEQHALPLLAQNPSRDIATACPSLSLPQRARIAAELIQAAAALYEKRKGAAIVDQDFDGAAQLRDRIVPLRKLAEELIHLRRPTKEGLQAVVKEVRQASARIGQAGR
jgi:hypothetical protein